MSALVAEFTGELERLTRLATNCVDADGEGLAAVELAIRTAMMQLGCSLLERLLAVDPGHHGPRIVCGAGHAAQFVGYRVKIVDTVLGSVQLRRAWYHCAECGHGCSPRDDGLGVAGMSLSPGLRAMIARAATAVPFAKARELLADLAGVELTTKRVERAAEADGAAAEQAARAETAAILARRVVPLPPSPMPDKLYVAIDGTGVPMIPTETAGRTGKADDGRARTRETKLACVFTQTRLDDDGRPMRDDDSASHVATFDPAPEFGRLMAAEARRRGANHIRQLIVLGDGAPWIWNLANTWFPEATQIVDLYHAREHVHDIANLLAPTLGEDHQGWLAERLDELDNGDIETLVANCYAPLPPNGKAHFLDKTLPYFKTNAHRMRYNVYRELGMFVGSGTVEAGCKAIIGQRLKLSGMRWSIPGATSILTLRCHDASGRNDQIWQRPHNQITAA
ncbi:ISKra4 family transposase [Phytoactinopolyspora endophytica]|uniref:ISKra4 family transposase n=1 Tax=Phytoactinopolyspora endophytica TaxID=1642495 RepID=UPI00101C6608|nr:ISKra4 family transposase [Phytoactinopolyspora endophytica]